MDLRAAVRQGLVEDLRLQEELTGIQVEYGWPGDQLRDESVFLGRTTGTYEIPYGYGPVTPANPITYDDTFTFPLFLAAAAPGQSSGAAEQRGGYFANAIVRSMRTNAVFALPQLLEGRMSTLDGEVYATADGFVFWAEMTLTFIARYEGTPT